MSSYIKNIAIVGAGGNLGSLITGALLEAKKFNITIISRAESESSFPTDPSITVKQGDYTSAEFLVGAFAGIEAAIFTLHWSAIPKLEIKLVEAAAEAGVKWIVPAEFGNDNGNEALANAVHVNAAKKPVRQRVEKLADKYPGLKWVGLVTSPWFDFCMKHSMFLIDTTNKIANLLAAGTAKFNTTTMATVALAAARVLSLPVTKAEGASLSDYGTKFVYVSSFLVSQRDILDSVQKATGTSDADWAITYTDVQAYIDEGPIKLAKGDMTGIFHLLMGNTMKEGAGGDYESVHGVSNAVLELPEESFDEAVKAILA